MNPTAQTQVAYTGPTEQVAPTPPSPTLVRLHRMDEIAEYLDMRLNTLESLLDSYLRPSAPTSDANTALDDEPGTRLCHRLQNHISSLVAVTTKLNDLIERVEPV